jgi:hypothetical protein
MGFKKDRWSVSFSILVHSTNWPTLRSEILIDEGGVSEVGLGVDGSEELEEEEEWDLLDDILTKSKLIVHHSFSEVPVARSASGYFKAKIAK